MTRLKPLLRDVLAEVLYVTRVTRPTDRSVLRIATFHRVLPAEELGEYPIPGLAVTPDELGWLLSFFGEHYECGRLDRIHERWVSGDAFRRPPLAITFDDGQLDNFLHAKPVLERAGVAGTFFVPTEASATGGLLWHDRAAYAARAWLARDAASAMQAFRSLGCDVDSSAKGLPSAVVRALKRLEAGERERFVANAEASAGGSTQPAWDGMMTPAQLRELAMAGHEVASHSRTHPMLHTVSDLDLERELVESRSWLERETGVTVTSFCYPNGDHDDRVVRETGRAGYRRAVTTRFGVNRRGADSFRLTRFDTQSETARSARNRLSRARVAWRLSGLHPGLK